MSQHKLTRSEALLLKESLNPDPKKVDIRLRHGEYQHDLAKGIASFELQLEFPDAKGLINELYGEKNASEPRFVRNIQTILKKMEKSDVVKILPKKRPWELQRYALSSFKFRDVEKNLVTLATPKQIEQTQNLLQPIIGPEDTPTDKPSYINMKIFLSAFTIIASYTAVLWSLLQPIINSVIFVPAFYVAFTCSLVLGKLLGKLITQKQR